MTIREHASSSERKADQARVNEAALRVDDLAEGLAGRTARGGIISVSGQFLGMLIQFASLLIMSRLLSPEDFGIVAMATAVTGLATIFADLGLSTATIQRKSVDQELASALFFVNLLAGLAMMALVCATAPVVAYLYGDNRVLAVLLSLSLIMPLMAAGAQHTALLSRRLRWLTLRTATLVSQFLGLAVAALAAALTDWGYWSLVAGQLTTALTNLLLLWRTMLWRPNWVRNWGAARESLFFGAHMTGANIVYWFARHVDNVLVGARWGAAELGQYTRAFTIFMLPINLVGGPVRTAVLPALSQLQDQPAAWRTLLLDIQCALMLVAGGITAVLLSTGDQLIPVLLGPQWTQSSTIFQILALSIPMTIMAGNNGLILTSLGHADRVLKWQLIRLPVLFAGFLIGLPYGAEGIAVAVAAIPAVMLLPGIAYATRGTPVSMWHYLRTALSPLSCIAIAAVLGRSIGFDSGSALLDLVGSAVTGAITFGIAGLIVLRFDPSYRSLRGRVVRQLGSLSLRRT